MKPGVNQWFETPGSPFVVRQSRQEQLVRDALSLRDPEPRFAPPALPLGEPGGDEEKEERKDQVNELGGAPRRHRRNASSPGFVVPSVVSPSGRQEDVVGALPSFGAPATPRVRRERAPSIAAMAQTSGAKGIATLELFLEAIHAISGKIEAADAAEEIIKQSIILLGCERATIFYVDRDELILMIAKGADNIRLPKNKGLAGYVASTGETLNIADAWEDPRFDNTHDKSSGFRTRSVLATPIIDDEGEIIAVLQCINRPTGFGQEEVVLIKNLAAHCSIVLRNAHLYEMHVRSETKINSLLEIVQMLHSDTTNTSSLIFTLSHRAHQLVDADRCTLYLVDAARKQLVVMQGDVDIRIPLSTGIAGHVATTGTVVNIPDCYADPRFNQAIDKKTGYHTHSMLCMPIFASKSDPEVVGVLQLMNRHDETGFLQSDEYLLSTLLSIAGPILKNSTFFVKHSKKVQSEVEPMKTPMRRALRSPTGSASPMTFDKIAEADGDE